MLLRKLVQQQISQHRPEGEILPDVLESFLSAGGCLVCLAFAADLVNAMSCSLQPQLEAERLSHAEACKRYQVRPPSSQMLSGTSFVTAYV